MPERVNPELGATPTVFMELETTNFLKGEWCRLIKQGIATRGYCEIIVENATGWQKEVLDHHIQTPGLRVLQRPLDSKYATMWRIEATGAC